MPTDLNYQWEERKNPMLSIKYEIKVEVGIGKKESTKENFNAAHKVCTQTTSENREQTRQG